MRIIKDVGARLTQFQACVKEELERLLHKFRVRSTIRWAVVSVQRKSRRRYKVNLPRFECRVVRSCEVCPTRENQRAVAPAFVVCCCLEMCACSFLPDGEPQWRMRSR